MLLLGSNLSMPGMQLVTGWRKPYSVEEISNHDLLIREGSTPSIFPSCDFLLLKTKHHKDFLLKLKTNTKYLVYS